MNNELLPAKRSIIPEVVDESGKKITGPEMETVLGMVTQMAVVANLARIRKSLEKEEFEGREDPRTLDVTDTRQVIDLIRNFPYTPWRSAYFINDGGDSAYIAINTPGREFELKISETVTLDHSKGDDRINVIYYRCDPTETAQVRVIGEY